MKTAVVKSRLCIKALLSAFSLGNIQRQVINNGQYRSLVTFERGGLSSRSITYAKTSGGRDCYKGMYYLSIFFSSTLPDTKG